MLRLDFGESIFLGEPVTQALLDRVQPTLLLTLYALTIQVLIGIPAGVLAAVRYNSPLDRALTVIAISGAAIPTFFLGILLILIFAVRLRWLPSGGYVPFDGGPGRALQRRCSCRPSRSGSPRPGCWRGWCAPRCSTCCAKTTCGPPSPRVCRSSS